MSNSKKEKTPSQKNSKTEKLFSTALLLNLSQFQNSIPDSELENQQRLNNSSSAIQGDSILNDLLSEDLINKIDQLSPIRSNNPPKKKMSDICLINCDDEDNFSPDSSSSDIQIKDENKIIVQRDKDNMKITIGESALNEIDYKRKKVQFKNNIYHSNNQFNEKNLNKTFNKEFYIEKDWNCNKSIIGNHQNKSQIYYYYNSTREYLSQEDKKLYDSLNNSHNYIPKNLINNSSMNNNSNIIDFKSMNLYNNNNSYNNNLSYSNDMYQKYDNLNSDCQYDNNQFLNQNSNNDISRFNANNYFNFYNNILQKKLQKEEENQNNFNFDNTISSQNNESNNYYNYTESPKRVKDNNSQFNNYSDNNNSNCDFYSNVNNQININQNININYNTNFNPVNFSMNKNQNSFRKTSIENEIKTPKQQISMNILPLVNQKEEIKTSNNLSVLNNISNNKILLFPNSNITSNTILNNSNNINNSNNNNNKIIINNNNNINNKININDNNHNNDNINNNINSNFNLSLSLQNQNIKKPEVLDKSEYLLEMFGRIGWICNQCNNFNYETRNKCNRCGISKQPKKREQRGDWTCPKCNNLNYGFRKVCNRCQIPRNIIDNLNLNNNLINQQQLFSFNNNLKDNNNNFNGMSLQLMYGNFPLNIINNGNININYPYVNNQKNNQIE